MGSTASKGGAAAGRAARNVAKTAAAGKPGPPTGSHLPADDDLLTNFKPNKGKRDTEMLSLCVSASTQDVVAVPDAHRCRLLYACYSF